MDSPASQMDPVLLAQLRAEPDVVVRARQLAEHAHAGQKDKTGADYLLGHLTDVHARAARYGAGSDELAAAWLHDVLEDTAVTEADLLAAGFSPETLLVVHLLTKREGEPDEVYWARLRPYEPARRLKLEADVASNADPARLAKVEPTRRATLEAKYARARAALE